MTTNRIAWLNSSDPVSKFPDVESALSEPEGLLAAGGDLSIDRLLTAYRNGIFPWYQEGQPILWWSPDPRCVLYVDNLHLSRRDRRYARRSTAELRFNTAFADAIDACAAERRSLQGTWITADMRAAFIRLHALGWAHSVETWDKGELIGGIYGLGIGRVFFGESMFSARPNASKFALLGLARQLRAKGGELIDCQVVSRHLLTLGATTLPRREFVALLASACRPPSRLEIGPEDPISVSSLVAIK